jgi:peptidoglycan/xylan/chitin deacetylase (PgdA/CDA1 family)
VNLRGLGRLQRAARRIQTQFAPGGLILMYHRVAEIAPDPFQLSVTPQHFAEHLAVLNKNSRLVSLPRMVQAIQNGESVHRMVAVTFDDGYSDNLYHAKPLLENYGVPATVFVATGNLGNKREFWSDELEKVLLQPGQLPPTLCLTIRDQTYEWSLGTAANYTHEAFQHDRGWSWYSEQDDPSYRHRLFRTLYHLLHSLLPHDRQSVMDQLLLWSCAQRQIRPTHRFLDPEEVPVLQNELIEVGAHTVTHPFLSKLSIAQQQEELQTSQERLAELCDRPVQSFAYPHGDYTPETVALAQKAGFACACSVVPRKVQSTSDWFQLPRMAVENWDGETFGKQLSQWFYS